MPKQSEYDKDLLARIIVQQRQVVTRAQLLECGLPHSTIDNKIKSNGPWQALLPGVYLTVTGTATQEHREIAALLYAGSGSVITGPCAVRRHRLLSPGPTAVDILVSPTVRRQSMDFVRLRRTERMPNTWYATGPVRFAEVPRAVADAARQMRSLEDVRSVVYEAVQQRACTMRQLITELDEGPSNRSSLFRIVLTEAIDGVRSGAEADFRSLVTRGRVPKPMFNAKLYTPDETFIAMVDAWWDDAGVAAEVDSRAYHLSTTAQDRDRDRHDRLIAYGVFPLHFSPRRISREGESVLAEIALALENGLRRPRLPILARPVDSQ
jgi:hypothetical protein